MWCARARALSLFLTDLRISGSLTGLRNIWELYLKTKAIALAKALLVQKAISDTHTHKSNKRARTISPALRTIVHAHILISHTQVLRISVLHPPTKILVQTASPLNIAMDQHFPRVFRLELCVSSPWNMMAKTSPSAVMNGHLGPPALARYAAGVTKNHARCSRSSSHYADVC